MEIIDYPNYLIYEDGRVFSKKKSIFLKPSVNTRGYKYVRLFKNNKGNHFKVHRLIAIHYIPNPKNKKEVDHINRIRDDNRIENLRWSTRLENQQNMGVFKNNKLGIKNISYYKRDNQYEYGKMINGIRHSKCFKTLQEAIDYKESRS